MPLFKFYFHFQRIKPRSQTQLSPLFDIHLASPMGCVLRGAFNNPAKEESGQQQAAK